MKSKQEQPRDKIIPSKKEKVTKKEVEKRFNEKEAIKDKLGRKCVYCDCTNELVLTIDHKIPTCRGGPDTDSNKQVCCYVCNQLKGPLTDEEYRLIYFPSLVAMKKLCKIGVHIERPQVRFNQDWYPSDRVANSSKQPNNTTQKRGKI